MADVVYDTLKGVTVAVAHSTLVNVGLTFMDNWLEGSIVSGTHLTSINMIQAIAGLSAIGMLMDFNSASLSGSQTMISYEMALTFCLNPVLGNKFENILSFLVHELTDIFVPEEMTEMEASIVAET